MIVMLQCMFCTRAYSPLVLSGVGLSGARGEVDFCIATVVITRLPLIDSQALATVQSTKHALQHHTHTVQH